MVVFRIHSRRSASKAVTLKNRASKEEAVMHLDIHFGWWVLPTLITMAAFVFAAWKTRDDGDHGDYAAIGNVVVGAFVYGAAIILSLLVWLIWAIVT